jgi:hypothetical protein
MALGRLRRRLRQPEHDDALDGRGRHTETRLAGPSAFNSGELAVHIPWLRVDLGGAGVLPFWSTSAGCFLSVSVLQELQKCDDCVSCPCPFPGKFFLKKKVSRQSLKSCGSHVGSSRVPGS